MDNSRQAYFKTSTIRLKSGEMMRRLASFRKRRALGLKRGRAALLVLDMQDYFLEPASHAFIPSAPAIVPGIRAMIAGFGRSGRPVCFTRHLNAAGDAGRMGIWWRELLTEDNPLSSISRRLDVGRGTILNKNQYDAFHETSLEAFLKERSVTQLVICGVMTHLCCETTARSAFVRGFEVFFAVDGTATYREAYHRASLLNLSHGFALPVLVREVLKAVRSDGE